MGEIVYCKDCAYAEPNNLDAYHAVKLGVFCTRYGQNTSGIHGCDNGKPKAKTNADRIRAMSDEELAEFIGRCVDHEFHIECVCFLNKFGYCQYPTRGCDENALEWLKQEAEDG